MLRYENSEWLFLLVLIPIIILVFIFSLRWRKKAIEVFGQLKLVYKLMPMASDFKLKTKFILFSIALTALIIGIANPQIGSKMEEVKREGVDLMIAIDLSNSMLAEDLQPNRLMRAKQSISKLIDRLQGDRIGLIVFAGEAYVQLPITTDYSAAKLFLSTINTSIVPTQGTAIGKAIELSIKSFDLENDQNKAIIVITDGENHEDDAIEKAKEAEDLGIFVHAIGMGSEDGGPIPIKSRNGRITGYQKDKEGNTVITTLNEDMLKQIAQAGGGSYIRANSTQSGLNALFKEINKMEKKEIGSKVFTDYKDRFQWFIGLAIILLLIETLIKGRKNKWSSKINLFEENEN
ncbi:VWA domain-containing protein [Flavobacteriales bacterium]|jgi:Ca-activated chloride channel family protein|nr:VWA domain-containing protein [Flavobacteriales bacterium]